MNTDIDAFRERVSEYGKKMYRDLPWRRTRDPYAVLVSEVMLQQTQVLRVERHWEQWLDLFPTPAALAAAPLPFVLQAWQGMGYNRRAINLKRSSEIIVECFEGKVPHEHDELLTLPGVGPASAAGVRVFAFDEPDMYLETNVRTVFLHEFFPEQDKVPDKELIPLVKNTCPCTGARIWYYALLDYGAWLKKTVVNPSRRSAQHTLQSKFEGSHRQKRAYLLRRVLEMPATSADLAEDLSASELAAGRDSVDAETVTDTMAELSRDGFVEHINGLWTCRQ